MKKHFILILVLFLTSCFSVQLQHRDIAQVESCKKEVLNYISEAECSAIAAYKQVEYTDINYFLRNKKWYGKENQTLLDHLISGVTKLPVYSGTVFRGTSFESSQARFKQFTTVGNIVSDPAFASSSQDRKIAESFLNDNGDSRFILMIIESHTGRNILGIGASGIDESEKEVLFLPGTQFVVNKVKKTKITNLEYGLNKTTVYEVYLKEI